MCIHVQLGIIYVIVEVRFTHTHVMANIVSTVFVWSIKYYLIILSILPSS